MLIISNGFLTSFDGGYPFLGLLIGPVRISFKYTQIVLFQYPIDVYPHWI